MAIADEIVRQIDLKAPLERVWQAVSDSRQFGQWFKCTVEGEFVEGETNTCRSTYEGSEEMVWQQRITAIQPETYLAYVWSPGLTGADMLDAAAGVTKVEFTLEPLNSGTRLTIRESGFASLPDEWRERSFKRNTEGWNAQVSNISDYVET